MIDIEQLRAALDRAEKLARAATPGPWQVDNEKYPEAICGPDQSSAVIAGGRWGETSSPFDSGDDALFIAQWHPAAVLRLVERDRKLLAANAQAQAALDEKVRAFEAQRAGELIAATARCKASKEQIESAAEFWLGLNPDGEG